MNRALVGGAIIGLALAAIQPGLAHAQFGRCTKVTEVTSETSVEISAVASVVCSVQLIATAASAWGVVFSSPSNTAQQSVQHGQFAIVAEPGSATAYNSVTHPFGDEGVPSEFGIGAFVKNGRMIVHWDS